MPSFISQGSPDTTATIVIATEQLHELLPSPRSNDDWLFTFTGCRSGTATVTPGAGWQTVYNVAGTYATLACFARITDGSESACQPMWSGMTTGAAGSCAESRCVNMGTGFNTDLSHNLVVEVAGAVSNQAASSTIMAGGASITPISDGAIIFTSGIFTNNVASAMTDTVQPEITWENVIADIVSSSGAKMIHGMSWGVMSPQGTVGVHTWTMGGATANNSTGVMAALAPTPPPTPDEQTDLIKLTNVR